MVATGPPIVRSSTLLTLFFTAASPFPIPDSSPLRSGACPSNRPYVPEQDLLLPPSLRDWLPEDHLAFFVSDLIDQLDLSAITTVYEDEERGYPPYHPVMLTKVLVYAYCVGVFSSRKIQRRLVEDVAFRVLAAGNAPDFRTIADFRKTHLAALRGFFEQVLRLARELGAPRVGRVALDGSKIKANASKHKAMSYGRMREKQRQLREEVKQLLDQAEAADAAEDAEYGPDRRGDELPAELQRRESRLKRIREAKRALEARAKDEAAAAGKPAESAKPDPKAQYNFTDPESRIMKGPDGFVQAYNVQVAVDELQLIVGHAVTQETNDKKQLMPMITTIEQQSGDTPDAAARRRGLLLGRELDRDRRHGPSTRTSRRGSRNMASGRGRVRAARCRRPPRSSTGCPASCTRRPARRSMPRAKGSSNR